MSRAAEQAVQLVPAIRWIARYERRWLRHDVTAGLVLAVMLIPQGMAYASLAGLPPVTGLYVATVPLLVYAALGTSSHLAFGPVALVSLLTAAALDPLAGGETARYVALAGALALLVGAIHLGLAALRAGTIVNLVSHPVISGFTSAAALVIALSQARDLLGFEAPRSEHFVVALIVLVNRVGEANAPTLVIGVACLAVMLAGRRVVRRFPWPLLVVVLATVGVWLFDLEAAGVAILGSVPAGLPAPALPPVSPEVIGQLWLLALTVGLVAYMESISIAKAIALRTRERISPDSELLASGAANTAAGLFGGFPVAGSFTRPAVAYDAGAGTQLAGVVAALVIALVVQVATGLFFYLPRTVLAAIVIVAVTTLVDVRGAVATFRTSLADGAVLLTTFVATLGLGVVRGLLTGIGFSLMVFLLRRTRPHIPELGRVQGTGAFRSVARFPVVTDPHVAILRLDAPLDFLTADAVTTRVARLVGEREELRALVLDASTVTALDATGVHALQGMLQDLGATGVTVVLATVRGPVRDRLARSGAWDADVGRRCHPDLDAALAAVGLPPIHPLRAPASNEPPTRLT